MGIWDFWKTEAEDYVFGLLTPEQAPAFASAPIEKDRAYVTVILRKMRIVNVRIGTKKFYAALHSDLGLWHDGGKVVNFKQLIAPPDLKDVSAESLDRTIIVDQPLLGPTPYRGGRLNMNLALLSVKSTDLAGPYLDMLSGLANVAGVSYIKVAEPFLKPLTVGIDLLTGTSGVSTREIQVMSQIEIVRAGVYVLVRAPKLELDLESLRVDKDYTLTDSTGVPVYKYPYTVVSIESSSSKYDWKGIPELKSSYEKLCQIVREGSPQYPEALAEFRRVLFLSDDLILSHGRQLYKEVEVTMNELMGPAKTGANGEKTIPTLESFDPFRVTEDRGT